MSKAFYHVNHEAPSLNEIDLVSMIALPPRPNKFNSKKEFVEWSHNPNTAHCYYSLWEPQDRGLRLTKDNPVKFMHGVVADYDCHGLEPAFVDRAIRECPAPFPVAYVSRTFSRGIRMVWLFERPLPVFSGEIARAVAERCAKELRLNTLAPAFDDEATFETTKYFELGTDWRAVNPGRTIPASYTSLWAFEASQRAEFAKEGISIPIEVIEAEVAKRWPGRWSGPFAVGSKGVRFWDPAATNESGAWIRETGVQAFTGECRFLHWGAIFGKEWVNQFKAEKVGRAIDNIYYDGAKYWKKHKTDCVWRSEAVEVLRRAFGKAALSPEKRGAPLSEVDAALNLVEDERRVDGAYPFLYSDLDIEMLGRQRYLNISRAKVLTPAQGTRYWGERFPWIASLIDGLFGTQKLVFLAWLAHAYQGGLRHSARQGHALFIVGGTGTGKTVLNREIASKLLGGFSEATSLLMGKDLFNGSIFESPVWVIDDGEITADRRSHGAYSEAIKKLVANPSQTYRRMYSDGLTLPWSGRIVVTLNESAIAMLPNIEADLMEKVVFLKAEDHAVSFEGYKAKLVCELPHLAAYLRDFVIPEDMKDRRGNRFGFAAYHHPDLLADAKDAAPSADIKYIVDQWRIDYFKAVDFKEKNWKGTAQHLYPRIECTGELGHSLRSLARTPHHLGRLLSDLAKQGLPWLHKAPGGQRLYTIDRPVVAPLAPKKRPNKIEVESERPPESPDLGAEGTSQADEVLQSALS